MMHVNLVTCRRLLLPLLLALLSPAMAAQPRFAYVVNAYDSSLSIYRVDAQSGRLRPLGHVPLRQFPSSVAAHPSGRFLFVSAQTGMTVQAFAVNQATGALTEVTGSPFDPGVVSPFWLALDPAGKTLYIAGRNSNAISAMNIDQQSGVLSLVKGAPFAGGYLPRAVAAHPTGPFVYMTNINDDSISGYRTDGPDGALRPIGDKVFPAGDAPQFLVMHPDGKRAWLTSWNTKTVVAYQVDPDSGVLSVDREIPLPDGIHPFGLDISGDGRFLYVVSWFGGIVGFRVQDEGTQLTPIEGSPFATFGDQPVQIFIGPADRFAYVTNYESHTLTSYRIDADSGALTPVETVTTRIGPRAMAFVSGDAPLRVRGGQLFGLDRDAGVVRVFDISAQSGELRPAGELRLPASADSLTVTADGAELLVADRARDQLLVYRGDGQGGWSPAPGSPFRARGGPVRVAVDYNNQYVYAVNRDKDRLSVYYLMPDTSALDEAPDTALFHASPYATVMSPLDLALHPTDRFAYVLGQVGTEPAELSIFKYYETGPLVVDVASTGVSPAVPLDQPYTELEVDVTGRYLYFGDREGHVSAWYLDSLSGQQRPMPEGRVQLSSGDQSLVADPVRSRLYVLNRERRQLQVLEMDADGNRLTPRQRLALPGHPLDFTVDASGDWAWLSLANNTVIVYKVYDGKLTQEKLIKTSGPLADMVSSRVLY